MCRDVSCSMQLASREVTKRLACGNNKDGKPKALCPIAFGIFMAEQMGIDSPTPYIEPTMVTAADLMKAQA